jgi:two-component system, cell cycle sensor histidine kinase and response regulator CckA
MADQISQSLKTYSLSRVGVRSQEEEEERLRRSNAKLSSLVERAPFGIAHWSLAKDRFESVNVALCVMLGYSEQELLAMDLSREVYANAPNGAELIDLLKRDRKLHGHEMLLTRKDGSQICARVTAYLISDTDGESGEVEAYFEDLTEQSALEQQIRSVQKLEAVGRLAGGVAHDFNNILVVIKLSTEMMLGQITPGSPLSRPLLQVSKAADRAAVLTKQMLAFSRRQMMQARVANINSVVSETSHMLRRIIGEDVELITRLADDLANSRLDPDQLAQVVLNLAVNARATPCRGAARCKSRPPTRRWTMPTAARTRRYNLAATSCWRYPIPGPALRNRICRAFSTPSSPPKKWARALG